MRMLSWRSVIIVLFLCLLQLVSGCGAGNEKETNAVPVVSEVITQDQLPATLANLKELYASHGVLFRMAYQTDEETVLEVRQANKPWEALTEEQLDKLRSDIYAQVGRTFALRIESFVLPKQADITGKITAIDGKRILVVDQASADSNPNAIWVSLPAGARSGLRIGYGVNVWSDGWMDQSYPAQTAGVQLQVTDFSVGKGDLQGTLTAADVHADSVEDRTIEVDGVKLRLLAFTNVMEEGEPVGIERLKPGTHVQVWTIGYTLMQEQQFASQINLVNP